MKIRNGFVSNSSSSSFVMFGIHLSRDKISEFRNSIKEKGLLNESDLSDDDDNYEFFESLDTEFVYLGDGDVVIGKMIACGDDNSDLDEGNISLTDLEKTGDELFNKYGIEKESIKLIFGSYPC